MCVKECYLGNVLTLSGVFIAGQIGTGSTNLLLAFSNLHIDLGFLQILQKLISYYAGSSRQEVCVDDEIEQIMCRGIYGV